MAKRSENRDEVIKRIRALPLEPQEDDGTQYTEEYILFTQEVSIRLGAKPDDAVLKLMKEARSFDD